MITIKRPIQNKIAKICEKIGWKFEWRDFPYIAFAIKEPYYIIFYWKNPSIVDIWSDISNIISKDTSKILLSIIWSENVQYVKKLLKSYS